MSCGCGCGAISTCYNCNTTGFVGVQSCTSPNGASKVSPGVTLVDAWVVPAVDSSVDITAYGNLQIPTGVDLYNPAYGYFQITAVNASGGGTTILTLTNTGPGGNQDPGFNVPAYSNWILTPHNAD